MNFLENPRIEGAAIAIIASSLTALLTNLVQFFIDKSKYNKELKTFFWKEKIDSAKKASEFYLEQINYYNILKYQFENFEKGKIHHLELFEKTQEEIKKYYNRIKAFPHFEHHHINLFYEFEEEKQLIEIVNKISEITREIPEIIQNNDVYFPEEKIILLKEKAKILKNYYEQIIIINKKFISIIRNDIKGYL